MRRIALLAIALTAATPALAQTAAPLKLRSGQSVRTADGQRIGSIDDVEMRGGQPVSVSIIYDQHFIHIPASTLTAGDKGLVTSLTNKDIATLN